MESPGGPGILDFCFWQTTVGAGALPQNCFIDWPPPELSPTFVPVAPDVAPQPHRHYHFAPAQHLSDEDVERIAKRVADLLREPR
jgi:hypothetical protein